MKNKIIEVIKIINSGYAENFQMTFLFLDKHVKAVMPVIRKIMISRKT